MRFSRTPLVMLGSLPLFALAACSGDDSGSPGGDIPPGGGAYSVSGTVVDFVTGEAVAGATAVSVTGVSPAPSVTIQGPAFTITGIPANSVFSVLAASAPTHHATIGPAIELVATDLTDVKLPALSESSLTAMADAFGVTLGAQRGVLLAQVVDAAGQPRENITGTSLAPVGANFEGPFFLDDKLAPAPARDRTSASGWVVYLEVDPGLVGMDAAAGANLTVSMPLSPIMASTVTLSRVEVIDGQQVTPKNVSFSKDIVPIFELRGCQACHSGSGPGRDLGNLTLDGSSKLIFRELGDPAVTMPTPRINKADPSKSLVLTMPSREDPPDIHPNVTFASPDDPDYQKLLVWITEGALQN